MVYFNIHKYNASRATNSGLGQPITYREINQKIVFECLVPIFWEVDTPVCFGDKGFFNKNLQKRLARQYVSADERRVSKKCNFPF